jgi:hypothetical protein
MSNKSASGHGPRDRSDWSSAWAIVSRLAAARDTALHELERTAPADARLSPAPAAPIPVHPELARAVAEIEQASAALRRSEPALEAWKPGTLVRREARRYRSVWLLIGGIWLSASLMVAGATGALLYLLG